jgi:hypothetical protein
MKVCELIKSIILMTFLLVTECSAAPKGTFSSNVTFDMSLVDQSKLHLHSGVTKLNKDVESGGWVMYKQCDARWAYQQLGWCSGLTICAAGCAMSSAAMMLATKGNPKLYLFYD